MQFPTPLIPCTFLRRYKRFLTDVRLGDGETLTVHCANSGSMKHCQDPDSPAWISDSGNPKRKLRHTLEIIEIGGVKICLNTQRPNALAEEAIRAGAIPELAGYEALRREVKYGTERSRIDVLLERGDARCYVEVKNATMGVGDRITQFPDAVTARGTRHLRELMAMVAEGHRAVLLFCAGRADTRMVQPADDIDPTYGETLRAAAAVGVELLAYRLDISPTEMNMVERVPVDLP